MDDVVDVLQGPLFDDILEWGALFHELAGCGQFVLHTRAEVQPAAPTRLQLAVDHEGGSSYSANLLGKRTFARNAFS